MLCLQYLAPIAFGLFSLASAADNSSTTVPIPPSLDPWYTAPQGWKCKPAGTPLRVRPAPGNISAVVNGAASAYNVMYRTSNSHYEPSWAVTTLLVPQTPNPKALLSYQIAYDTHYLDDSPSYTIYTGLTTDAMAWELILASGLFINLPDYEGPTCSFGAGITSGLATIDSIRALLSLSDELGLAADAQYAMWGYSGGALASQWAAELQEAYAPEMNFAGMAIGGVPINATSVIRDLSGTPPAGLAFSAIWGLTSQYPGSWDELLKRMKTEGPMNVTGWTEAVKKSVTETAAIFANQDLSEYFTNGFDFLSETLFSTIFYRDGTLGHSGTPKMPVYAYKAIQDEINPIAELDEVIDQYCLDGANILYERNTIGDHAAEGLNGAYPALFWLQSVFAGTYGSTYNTTGCTIRNVTTSYSDFSA
ncbi:unnamed protein product [Clonostachys rhizophaga]|uniref:Uncharacterized protein n=1 Tax=Clonostachys rhizophaga TaxID=160324 RepID=A0A9N9V4W9_9HYPO|nr:unnamed protein product [Clonostachys rhizophaga]